MYSTAATADRRIRISRASARALQRGEIVSSTKTAVRVGTLAVWLLIGSAHWARAADDTARFYGTWVTSVPVNGQLVTMVSLHNAKGYTNSWRSPSGSTPAGSGGFTAADGKYRTTAPWPNDSGTYRFTDDDTVVCTNAAGQTATWRRDKTASAPPASALTPVDANAAANKSLGYVPPTSRPGNESAPPAAPSGQQGKSDSVKYDPSLPPETNAAIAAFDRKDYATAWRQFMIAAKKADAEAQAGVGAMLLNHLNPPGTGTYAESEHWLQASANQGNAKGMGFLGQYYFQSARNMAGGINPGVNTAPMSPDQKRMVEERFSKARDWFERAAAKNDVYAMGNLATMLDAGVGGPADPARAKELRERIKAGPDKEYAQRATADAGFNAVRAAWQAAHYADAVNLATKLANQGNGLAEALLARAYYQGQGVAIDYHAAFSWAQRAEKANVADGIYFLGKCYENGYGVARNLTKASDLFDRAIALGHQGAMAEKAFIDVYVFHKVQTPSGGPLLCAKGVPDGVFNAGCIGEDGGYVDPSTGKPLY
jgi:TPR repeat protein